MSGRRLLFLDTPLEPPGGGQFSLLTLLGGLDSGRFEPVVFLSEGGVFHGLLKEKGFRAEIVPLSSLFFNLLSAGPDLIHCNSSTTRYTLVAALAAKVLNIPLIWHNRVVDVGGWKERLIARLVSRIIVISDAVGGKFAWCAEKVVKVYNAVDIQTYCPRDDGGKLRGELGILPGSHVIGVFSRLELWKGQELFLRAASLVERARPRERFCFLLVGEGPDRERLAGLTEGLGLAGSVKFAGFRPDIPALMNLCDVVINPSVEPEPFGRVIIEAMACGRPVIATDMGGPREIIENGLDGLLSAPSPAPLAEAVLSLLPGGELYDADIGARARLKALTRFDAAAHAAAIAEVYRECLRKKRGGRAQS